MKPCIPRRYKYNSLGPKVWLIEVEPNAQFERSVCSKSWIYEFGILL